jgi:DNA-binding Lrp family transcriptional regulator
LIAFSTGPKDRQKLLELLDKSRNVNSLRKINNGWDYMAEVVFPGVKEVEEFIETIEEQIRLKGRKVFYIIDEIKRESFLSNPSTVGLVA